MKVKRIIRRVTEEDKKNFIFCFPYLEQGEKESFANNLCYSYLQLQQLSLEELRQLFLEKWEPVIWKERHNVTGSKEFAVEEYKRGVEPEIIKIQEKIKNRELLRIRWQRGLNNRSFNDKEKMRVKGIIFKRGGAVSHSNLLRSVTHFANAMQLSEIIKTLIDEGEIKEIAINNVKHYVIMPTKEYRWK